MGWYETLGGEPSMAATRWNVLPQKAFLTVSNVQNLKGGSKHLNCMRSVWMTIWQGYWRGDSTVIWLNLTFLTTSLNLKSVLLNCLYLPINESSTSWVSGMCKAWGYSPWIREVLWLSFNQDRGGTLSSSLEAVLKDWLCEIYRKQDVFLLPLGCWRMSLWASRASFSYFTICSVHLHANCTESMFTLLASMSLFVLFFFLGSWGMELSPVRTVYTDLGEECVWTWRCNDI